jgi:glycosyltransferase involved in cell wall biosynthesis
VTTGRPEASAVKTVLNGYFWKLEATGSGQYLRWLAEHLKGIPGLHVSVVKPTHRGTQRNSMHRGSKIGKLLWEQYGFPREAKAHGAHLVHVPYFAPVLWTPAPQIVTVHDVANLTLPEYRGSLLLRLYFLLARLGLRRTSHVITDTEAARREIIEVLRLAASKVTAIHLGVDPDLKPLEPGHPGVSAITSRFGLRQPFLLYLGGYDARKNLPTLVEAYAHLVSLGSEWGLVIAGEFPERWGTPIVPDLPAVIRRYGLEQRVILTGRLTSEERLLALNAASAFVFPSSYEGFGLPPLEAMACGLPVIAARTPAVVEVCGDAAVYVAPRSVPELVQAMYSICTEPELRSRLREAGLHRARSFTWKATAERTAEVYFEVARHHARSSGQ